MRMVSTLYTLQIVLAVSVVWRPSHAVHQLSCGETITLTTSTATTYRFGDFTNPYGTGLSCTFNFNLSDASERIISRLFPQCTSDEDVLQINSDGNNLCCFNCARPISGPSSSLRVSFSTDTTTGPKELGFEIMIVTGKDESKCVSPSSNISVTVGPSPVIITSPGFPNKYQSNSDCSYIISPQDSSKGFSLTFDVISLDYEGRCYDTITLGIYNKDPVNICTKYTIGNLFLPNERYTSGGETYLHFKSDERSESYGFRVTIVQVDLGATQPPTAASTTTVQTVETTTSTTAPSHSDPTTGIQNPSQTDGTIEPMNMLIITAVASSAVILLTVVVVFACFLKRKKASRILSNREEMFQNPTFIGQGNETFSDPSVEQYEQIMADKMLSESQIKNRAGSGGDYESRANLGEDHTYQGLIEARRATNKAFSESYNSQLDDYDSPHDSVSNDH